MKITMDKTDKFAHSFRSLINVFGVGDLKQDSLVPMILAISLVEELNAPDQGSYYPKQSWGIDRESMSNVVRDILQDIERAIKFMKEFSDLYCQENIGDIPLAFVRIHPDILEFSVMEGMSINRESNLSLLRDWLACYGTTNQCTNFETRCFSIIEDHNEFICNAVFGEKKYSLNGDILELHPVKGNTEEKYILNGQIGKLYSMIGFLEILTHSISYPEPLKSSTFVTEHSLTDRPDDFGTPQKLLRLAHILRVEFSGREVSSAEVENKLGLPPTQLIAPMKNVKTPGVIDYAKAHLMAGRGRWKWMP